MKSNRTKISQKKIKVGLAGFGTVGSGVAEILEKQVSLLEKKLGGRIILARVATRTPQKAYEAGFLKEQVCTDWRDLVNAPELSIIVELIGGVTEAKELILSAIRNKKQVVTANKALLALHGKRIFEEAQKKGVEISFEAAVAGGIPVLRSLREGFTANKILSISGIINGTCNYILTQMSEHEQTFEGVLKEAQNKGYAEQDPSFDIGGIDAAHKLSILASIAYGVHIRFREIYVEGIEKITSFDMESAKRFGFTIKLLGIAKQKTKGIQVRVHPVMVPLENPLASVKDVFNAILIEGDATGPNLLYGRGAGKLPTASAVVGDIVEITRNIFQQSKGVPPLGFLSENIKEIKLLPISELETEYYLRFSVFDKPGVLAQLTGILGKHRISIAAVYQSYQSEEKTVPIVILTHQAKESDIQSALKKISRLKAIENSPVLIRIERGLEN